MTDAEIDLGLQYADTINLARGILDSAGEILTATEDLKAGRDKVLYEGDYNAVLEPWDRLIQARATAQAWCDAYTSRGYNRPPQWPLTPAEVPT